MAVLLRMALVGQPSATRGLLVDRLEALSCDSTGQANVLEYAQAHGVNRVYLYLSALWFSENPKALDSMITEYHQRGVAVWGIVSPSSFEPMPLEQYAQNLQALDGIFLEYEYWANGDPFWKYKWFVSRLRYALPGKPFVHYIGWPATGFNAMVRRLRFMVKHGEEITVHLYRSDIDLSFVKPRLAALQKVGASRREPVKVSMLYSSEPGYMMHKLQKYTPQEIHQQFEQEYQEHLQYPNLALQGWNWFKASDMVGY